MRAAPASYGRARPADRFVSKSRAAGMTDAAVRAAWVLLLRLGCGLAARVAAGEAVGHVEGLPFADALQRHAAPWPQRQASAQTAAEAFLMLGRAFVANGYPAALAGFLAAGATALADMMDAETRAAFERSCRVAGADQ